MKLTHIKIKDFRSFSGEHSFDVTSGVNYFVGPNNCGKSNLIKALAIALDPDAQYIPERDAPFRESTAGPAPRSRITLRFSVGASGPEKTLLSRADAYERRVRESKPMGESARASTYSSGNELRMVTTFGTQGARQTTFEAKGMGGVSLPAGSHEHKKLEEQFRRLVRFAVIHSGEDLESLLKGKFREILQLVIEDHLSDEMRKATEAREQYLATLQAELLEPLRNQIRDRVSQLFPEIAVAELVPAVPTLAETLSSVDVRLGDAVTTQLSEKGTGVRGAVLVSMLQYLAEQSRRSLVLAVEEPEAFMHPGAQESIRGHLDDLATRSDVSLLVTTHSPYVISRQPDAHVTELGKQPGAGTMRLGSVGGDADRAQLLGSLYRDSGFSNIIERSLTIPDGTSLVVVTEGYTDGRFLEMACRAAGREDVLEGMYFVPAGGASKVVPQAILARAAGRHPVVALLDHDEHGRSAADSLKAFGWRPKFDLVSLNSWKHSCGKEHDVEIEDVLAPEVVAESIKLLGEDLAVDSKFRCEAIWHYRLSKAWKEWAISGLPSMMKARPGHMVAVAEQLRTQGIRVGEKQTRDAAMRKD